MPRRADTPCAGGCGVLLWRGTGSRPDPVCRSCRALRHTDGRPCETCGESFISHRADSRYCSRRCIGAAQRRTDEHRCEWCGQLIRPHQRSCSRTCLGILRRLDRNPTCPVTYGTCAIETCRRTYIKRGHRVTCSRACSRRWNTQAVVRRYHDDPEYRACVIAAALNRYAGRLGAGEIRMPRALTLYLIDRDHGICGICHQPVTETSGELGPSVDHVIPLRAATGPLGTHTIDNIQLAHLRCNRRKGNRTINGLDLRIYETVS